MTSELKVLEMKIPLQIKSALVGFFLCAVTPVFAAPIVANFDDGNSSTYPDGYGGTAGGGWADGWKTGGNRFSTSATTGSVINTNPLNGGGNYLRFTVATTKALGNVGNSQGFVQRQVNKSAIGFTDISQPLTISFDFRPETTLTSGQSYFMFGSTSNYAGTGDPNTWGISGAGDAGSTWQFGAVKSGISIVTGTVYHFTLEIDPATQSYFGTVSDGVSSFTTEAAVLFRALGATNAGEWLNFGVKLANSGTAVDASASFSIDNLMIIPEPSTVALLTTAAGIAMVRMFRRRRSAIA